MKWDAFSTPTLGYTAGKRSYTKHTGEPITDEAVSSDLSKWPVKKGTDVSFAVTLAKDSSNAETHEVIKWVVEKRDGETYIVTETTTNGKFVLENNNTKLTIKDVQADCTVQVVLQPLYTLELDVGMMGVLLKILVVLLHLQKMFR